MTESAALDAARGAVRDGLAAIENLGHLLGSRRVGRRWLENALPAMQAGCAPLSAALEALDALIGVELSDDAEGRSAFKALLAQAASRVTELRGALEALENAAIDARERLALETIVHRVKGELDTVIRLTDLVCAATTFRTTAIDLGEVLAERHAIVARSRTQIAAAAVELRTHVLVGSDARIVLELLEFAVATVFRSGVSAPSIVADRNPAGDLEITVSRAASDASAKGSAGRTLEVTVRPELPREADVVAAAARRVGIDLRVAPGGASVTIVLRGVDE